MVTYVVLSNFTDQESAPKDSPKRAEAFKKWPRPSGSP